MQKLEPIENIENTQWLDKTYRKSKSARTRVVAKTSLKTFDMFCETEGMERHPDPDVTFGYVPKIIEQYKIWYNPKPNPDAYVRPNVASICKSLDRFVAYMDGDYEFPDGRISSKKSSKKIELYFTFVKSYLRTVHEIKLSTDDIKDFVTFPKKRKEYRVPLTLKQAKAIMNNTTDTRRKAIYYMLISSGMRLGEVLSLRKKHIHFEENPCRISIESESTKTGSSRETFISSEAVEKLTPILENITDNEQKIFVNSDNLKYHVSHEDKCFGYLRQKLGLMEKYPNSVRYVINLHSFRAYFHTKATLKHGDQYAHNLLGHEGSLEQYHRLEPKKKADMYKQLEEDLLIESVKITSDKNKDKIIEDLLNSVRKLEDKDKLRELIDS